MLFDEDREEDYRLLQDIEADINRFTATVAEDMAQRGTTPQQIAAMEHLLVVFELLCNGYQAAMEAFDRDDLEQAEAILDEVSALRTRLLQWLGRQ
jgi:hypothetical protein